MITLTDNAVEKLNTLITGSRKLRVLVKGTGCSGMAYHLEYNIMETDQDDSFMVRGVPVIIDKKSQVYVEGAEIDHKKKGLNEGFEFYNPREKARCGCGESFTVQETKLANKEDEGKLELSVRILGNEIIGFKMVVDDFKMKWMLLGLVAIGAISWIMVAFGPTLMETFQ